MHVPGSERPLRPGVAQPDFHPLQGKKAGPDIDHHTTRPDRNQRQSGLDSMSSTQPELLPTRLLRAAQGNRAHEAAIVLLARAGVLNQLNCCIILDPDHSLAWLDWPAVAAVAGRASDDVRVILGLASTIATQGQHITPRDHEALRIALEHLSVRRP
jgi:hypothetical protein